MANVANGQATKIIIPSDLQNVAALATTVGEMFKEPKHTTHQAAVTHTASQK